MAREALAGLCGRTEGRNRLKRVFTKTAASGMQDVAALSAMAGGPLTMCGVNGTVWRSKDGGATFSQIAGTGLRRLAIAANGSHLWGVGKAAACGPRPPPDNGASWRLPPAWARGLRTSRRP